MTLLWLDGFDHYGNDTTGRTNMLQGVWAELSGGSLPRPATTPIRTGTNSLFTGDDNSVARRVFPNGDLATVGLGYGLYFTQLPTVSDKRVLAEFRNASNTAQLTLTLSTTGQIRVLRGGSTGTLLVESAPVITAAAWNHFECKVTCDDAAGAAEVRVNGITVINISGVDTRNSATGLMAQVRIGTVSILSGQGMYIDDLFCWDTNGSHNNDFIGPQRVYRLLPNGNTAEADWTVSGAATGYEAIDDVPPDGDTSYIAAAAVNDISEFDMEDLPAEVTAVTALYVTPMSRKTDAGTANLQASILSGASAAAGADRPITEAYTYWADIFETDPDTGAPWTASAVNAAKLRLEKTA